MIRLSKIEEFKNVDSFINVLNTSKVRKKPYGGYAVWLVLVDKDEGKKIIHVSRNQLAKLALKLTQTNDVNFEQFRALKNALNRLNGQGSGGGRVTGMKQRVGNAFFKMHHGADRVTLLQNKLDELDPDSPFNPETMRKEFAEVQKSIGKGAANAVKELERRDKEIQKQLNQPHIGKSKKHRKTANE